MTKEIREYFSFPMILTYARFVLIPFIGIGLMQARWHYALTLFVVAALTDVFDGALARLLDKQSTLGTYLDPLADKLLIITCFLCLWSSGALPAYAIPGWFILLIAAKEILLALGALYIRAKKNLILKATWAGKVAMAVEVTYTGFILLGLYAGYEASQSTVYLMRQTVALCIIGSLLYYAYYAFCALQKN